jgi:single-strand DNA-binding protein
MYNKVIVVGNLTRDIELRYMPNGSALAKSAIATSHRYKSQTGEQKEEVCFLDFNMFGRSAEIANQYLKKGSKVLLEGRLVLEQWTAQDGTNRSKHALRVDTMKMLDTKSNNSNQPQSNSNGSYSQQNQYNPNQYSNNGMNNNRTMQNAPDLSKIPEIDIDDDEIPF